ncbi:hypothetical protein [Microbacterium thalassium]|uniref:Uncharacterized protein n=1 Tax=Microbacterium thalassium TaxID=362649 RepID=A0A7X0FS31_9MICO|nr:hypothetical protein [Microbacterium thalassium]MBB6392664.1 hypothetical protein [Microbacterium thalassium]GLK23105.1 hypothetical protein GCM10017607_04230 [Microbacterium thalassium]
MGGATVEQDAAGTPRRRAWWIALAVAAALIVVVVVAVEVAARHGLASRYARSASAGTSVEVSGSVTWGFVTGSQHVTITVDEATMRERAVERSDGVIDDLWIDGGIHLSATRAGAEGDRSVEVLVVPQVVDGAVVVDVASATVDSVAVPMPPTVDLGLPDALTAGGSGCIEPHAIVADAGALTIEASVPAGFGWLSSGDCRRDAP